MEVASDDLAFIVINAKDDHPILLNGIVGELQTKITSPFLFVILPQLTGISGICTLSNWRKGFQRGASWSLKRSGPALETITMFGKFHHMSL